MVKATRVNHIRSSKKAHLAPSESERLFLQLADNVDVGFMLRELSSRTVLYASPGFSRVFGFDPTGPTPGFPEISSRIHPDDRAAHVDAAQRADAGERVQRELRILRPDGEVRWIRFSGTPVMDEQETLIRVAATFEDVTERKQSEIALREAQGLLQRTADALQVGLALRQLDRPKFLFVSSQYTRILGIEPTMGTDPAVTAVMDLVHPDDRDGPLADHLRRIRDGSPSGVELRIVRPSGQTRWLRVNSNPVETAPGAPPLLASSVEDITERKIAEEALVAAQREAELANRAKNEFLSRMSHELRTPLNAVLGFAQLLELDPGSDSQLDAIGHILRGGRHLLEMINDLLDLARIESDQFEMSIEPIGIDDVLFEAVGLLQTMASDHGIAITIEPSSAAHVLGDRRRLRQVLLNVVSNAIKYNRKDGRIDISCEPHELAQLRISVTDTGIGVRADDLDRLFSPFDRLGQQATEIEGTGIGLALSRQLVVSMGGQLDVESTFGSGTTFSIVLPMAGAPGTASENVIAADHPAHTSVLEGAATLLYIEDNRTNAQLMQGIVRRRRHWGLVHARDGFTGLQQALALRPDLIFLDLHLPDGHGIDVLRELHANPITAQIPIAIVSADASPGQVSRMLSAGAQTYLTKPIQIREVLHQLDLHARRAPSERPTRPT